MKKRFKGVEKNLDLLDKNTAINHTITVIYKNVITAMKAADLAVWQS